MKFKISEYEKEILLKFKNSSYPSIYKTDNTDNILFVELVDFDVCTYLLKGKQINKEMYDYIINSYEKFLSQAEIDTFDECTLSYYNNILKIMEIFKKYYKI